MIFFLDKAENILNNPSIVIRNIHLFVDSYMVSIFI